MKFRADEIASVIQAEIENYQSQIDVREVGRVLEVGDGIARVYGLSGVMAGEMVEFPGGIIGLAFNLEENSVGVIILGDFLKITEGDASGKPEHSLGNVKLDDERGFAEAVVSRSTLNEVIRQRLEETLRLVKQRLPAGSVEAIGSGIYLTGGTSLMRGFSELAFEVFGRDIYRPELPEISGIQSNFKDPRYATAIGLIRYAQILETERAAPPGLIGRVARMFWPFGR